MEEEGLLRAEESPQVSAYSIKRHVSEIEQPGKSHDDVQAQRQRREHRYLENYFQVEYVARPEYRHQDYSYQHRERELDSLLDRQEIRQSGRRREHEEGGNGTRAKVDEHEAENGQADRQEIGGLAAVQVLRRSPEGFTYLDFHRDLLGFLRDLLAEQS